MLTDYDPNLETLLAHGTPPTGIVAALSKPNGSKFYRCAFQVNPFAYGQRHAKDGGFETEADYNDAMAKACGERGIQVVAITDHFRFDHSITLADRLRTEGVIVFPGFEANSSEGVHILCLFPPETTASEVNVLIGACDIRDPKADSPISNKTCEQLLQLIQQRGGIAITAHVTANAGLLTTLNGEPRMNAWKSGRHLAAAITGPIADVPAGREQVCRRGRDAARHCVERVAGGIGGAEMGARPLGRSWRGANEVNSAADGFSVEDGVENGLAECLVHGGSPVPGPHDRPSRGQGDAEVAIA